MSEMTEAHNAKTMIYTFNKQCFEPRIPAGNIVEIQNKLEMVSSDEKLQIILLKLWDLGKYIRFNNKIKTEIPAALRRSERKMVQ